VSDTTNDKKLPGTEQKLEAELVDEKTGKHFGHMTVTKRDMIVAGITTGVIGLVAAAKVLLSKQITVEKKDVEIEVPVPTVTNP
jgi:hypothetical protein